MRLGFKIGSGYGTVDRGSRGGAGARFAASSHPHPPQYCNGSQSTSTLLVHMDLVLELLQYGPCERLRVCCLQLLIYWQQISRLHVVLPSHRQNIVNLGPLFALRKLMDAGHR